MLGLLLAHTSLHKDYAFALADLYAAGLRRMFYPGVPGWYHAQRVIVAALRRALVQVEQTLHDAGAAVDLTSGLLVRKQRLDTTGAAAQEPLGRVPTQLTDHHFALRVREGECLLKLRDRARELARESWSRTLPTDDERRLAATRQREELLRVASEWNREGAWLMSPAPAPVPPA